MLLVPTGSANLMLSCRSTWGPISCWCCLQRVVSAPVVTLVSTYLMFWSSWTHASASSSVVAACRRCASVTCCAVASAGLNILCRMGPVGPCMLWTCISIFRMCHNCHHMLGVWVWICAFLPRLLLHHLLALPLLCRCLLCLVEDPPVFWDQVLCLLFTAVAWGCPWLGRAPLPCKITTSCWTSLLYSWRCALLQQTFAAHTVLLHQAFFGPRCWIPRHVGEPC